ncbi:hypothetical protein [Paenibacillus faecalis]|uniref:hypothetical protein n=1 Tax=Paenibacillus faecalis TaxID=2079532 RepID=UPI001F22AECA|nr:hypothetical protein [Paenibacillus faecalis]
MMSIQYTAPGPREHILYQAGENYSHGLKSTRDHIHHLCRKHMNQLVRVETMDGDVFEGIIVHCDRGIMHLSLPASNSYRGFNPFFYSDVILPLVLYELLVITLLYT